MSDPLKSAEVIAEPSLDLGGLQDEIVRLNKMVRVLMDRAERGATIQGSSFSIFQTTVLLEEQVRQRTAALEAALRENEAMTRALKESESRFRGLVSQSLVGISIIEDHHITYANDTLAAILGYTTEEIIGSGPLDYIHPQDRAIVEDSIERRLSGEVKGVRYTVRGLHRDGREIHVEVHGNLMEIGAKKALISLFMDVTDRVRAEREINALQRKLIEQAIHDPLTGLHNRRHFDEVIINELARAERSARPLSLLITDIDHFKKVNDTYGHHTGDLVLRWFAGALRGTVRSSDVVCRYGGEEFVVLMPDTSLESATARAEEIRAALRAAPRDDGLPALLTASFGVATFPRHGPGPDQLLRHADEALYRAKAAGRDRVESARI